MDVTINLKNADDNLLKAIKEVIKLRPLTEFKINKSSANEWEQEYQKLLKSHKNGKTKSYSSAKEMHEDIFNG